MLKPFSRTNLKPIILKSPPDVEMPLVTSEDKKENEENDDDKSTNKDLKVGHLNFSINKPLVLDALGNFGVF